MNNQVKNNPTQPRWMVRKMVDQKKKAENNDEGIGKETQTRESSIHKPGRTQRNRDEKRRR